MSFRWIGLVVALGCTLLPVLLHALYVLLVYWYAYMLISLIPVYLYSFLLLYCLFTYYCLSVLICYFLFLILFFLLFLFSILLYWFVCGRNLVAFASQPGLQILLFVFGRAG